MAETATEKHKILIVDDDAFLLDMYALKFSQSNFEVTTASNPEKALEILRGGLVPKIMLLDVLMPIMDGFQLLKVMQDEKLIPTTVKIILSNRGQQSDIKLGESLGASGYIVKASMTPSEVVTEVMKIVGSK
ncbi:MAG: response regulator transcription factor [Candidatus Pacebacteria bacterium]|jgi:DNA-binding response OmpR family regulator|nr:response regulator transcription factor [Candidatus Paceibacterota bacterium]